MAAGSHYRAVSSTEDASYYNTYVPAEFRETITTGFPRDNVEGAYESSEIHAAKQGPSHGVQEVQGSTSYQGAAGFNHTPTTTPQDAERPKVVLKRSLNPLSNIVHLLALASTIPVLWLNFQPVYWADETDWRSKWYLFNMNQQDSFNALQFAAKIHEIFVVGSVSAMVMYLVRGRLIGRRGLPFGLVVGAYQIGSAEYFGSKSFRVPLFRSVIGRQWRVTAIAVLIGLSIVYANMVGPASATLLIPNLDWYPVSDPFNGLPLATFLSPYDLDWISDPGLYPRFLNVSEDYSAGCANATDIDTNFCPGAGFSQLDAWFQGWAMSGIQHDPLMDVLLGKMQRQVISRTVGANKTEPGVAVASTIHAEIALLLDLFSQYVDKHNVGKVSRIGRPKIIVSDGTPVFSPLVQVQCNGVDQRTALASLQDGNSLHFATDLMQNFSTDRNAYESDTWQVPTDLWSTVDASESGLSFTWIPASKVRGASNEGESLEASITALARVPVVVEKTHPNGTTFHEQESLIAGCVVDARWAATAIAYDSKKSNAVDFNLSDPTQLLNSDNTKWKDGINGSDFGVSDIIALDMAWAATLNEQKVTDNNVTVNAITLLLSRFVGDSNVTNSSGDYVDYANFVPIGSNLSTPSYYANVTATISTLLSNMIADGIARTNYMLFHLFIELSRELINGTVTAGDLQVQAGFWGSDPSQMPVSRLHGLDHVELTVERYGWGYGLNPPTAKFAVAVLLIYVIMLVMFQALSTFIWLPAGAG